jgi:hypothetical protein
MALPRMLDASVIGHSPPKRKEVDFFKWGLRPQTPGIYRIRARIEEARERLLPSRAIPASESALRLRPRRAVPSAQVFPGYQFHASSILQVLRGGDDRAASEAVAPVGGNQAVVH